MGSVPPLKRLGFGDLLDQPVEPLMAHETVGQRPDIGNVRERHGAARERLEGLSHHATSPKLALDQLPRHALRSLDLRAQESARGYPAAVSNSIHRGCHVVRVAL